MPVQILNNLGKEQENYFETSISLCFFFVCCHCISSHPIKIRFYISGASVSVYVKHQKDCGRICRARQSAVSISKTCLMSLVQSECITVWMIISCHSVGHQSDVVYILSLTMLVLLWPQLPTALCKPLDHVKCQKNKR